MSQQYQMIDEVDGFGAVGSKSGHYWCGIWQTYGCLNHKQAFVRQFKRTCFRSECKVCYVSWASRLANRAVKKLNRMQKNSTLHHAVFTITTTWTKEAKQNVIKSLKNIGIESACIIYTPFDESDDQKYYLKNTLHIFYYGKMVDLYSLGAIRFEKLDDPKDNLFRILQTQFLSCGVKKGTQPVTWIGRTIYCTIPSEIKKSDGRNCPICDDKLHLIYFDGKDPPLPPDISFNDVIEKAGWKYCFSESIWQKIKRKIRKISSKIILIIK